MLRSTERDFRARRASVFALTLALGGCAGQVADWIVEAPNQRRVTVNADTVALFQDALDGTRETIQTPAGVLAYLRVPSRPYDITLRTQVVGEMRDDSVETWTSWSFAPGEAREPSGPPRGTVVVLHGFEMTKEVMGAFAALMADAGFDVVLADLPAHGQSGGDFVTWGVREAPAINALRRQLEADGARRPLIGFGVSLGGSIALRAAALEPGWDAVIAQQPFEDPAAVIPNFRAMAPAWLRMLVTEHRLAKAVAVAERRAGFDFDDARLVPLLDGYRVPTLIEHGRQDSLVPVSESEAIAAAAPEAVTLLIDDDGDHFTVPLMLWRRCPNVLGWLGARFALARLDAACERITYDDPDGVFESLWGGPDNDG